MNIIFRVDSSLEIGTGHVMRCLTLAHQLKNDLHSIYFICRDHEGNISDIIKENGFNLILLKNTEVTDGLKGYEKWLSVPWDRDADETIAAIETLGIQPDLLIIDHYGIDQKWEKMLHPKVGKVLVIDDLANRKHDCDYLIDQNYYVDAVERYNGLLSTHTRLFLGPSYALLREEFYNTRKEVPRKETESVNSILIFMGGSDSDNITQFILESLLELDKNIELKVVVGKNNPHKQNVKAYTDILENALYFEQVDNMAELMVTSDLAIGAGGTTTWERCYLGLPTATITVAENQIQMTKDAEKFGAIWYLGHKDELSKDSLFKTIKNLTSDIEEINKKQNNSYLLMNKNSAENIINLILEHNNGT